MSRTALRAGACVAASLVAAAAASPAQAAKLRISVHASPATANAGEPIVIYGHVIGRGAAHRRVMLMTRPKGSRARFKRIRTVKTNSRGFFSIVRRARSVTTNYTWFVHTPGAHSRHFHQIERALVSLSGPASPPLLSQPVVLTGRVIPSAAGEQVVLQQQGTAGGGWSNAVGPVTTDAAGRFTFTTTFGKVSAHALRAHFLGTSKAIEAFSVPVDVIVQQPQNANVTLVPSADPLAPGAAVSLAGRLVAPRPGGRAMTLMAGAQKQPLRPVATGTTAADGTFLFTQPLTQTTVLQAQVAGTTTHSVRVIEGVSTVVTAHASRLRTVVGRRVTFSGTVAPAEPGHVVELQQRGIDGAWHTLATTTVATASTYRLSYVAGSPGRQAVRILVQGGPTNLVGWSGTMTLNAAVPTR